jgi:leucyl-tRNA synthetase
MLAPVTPHIAEELWSMIGKTYSVHTQSWPKVDEAAAAEDEITLVVQVNGKLRDRVIVPASISEEDARNTALACESVKKSLKGKEPLQVIYVKGRLVNIVI